MPKRVLRNIHNQVQTERITLRLDLLRADVRDDLDNWTYYAQHQQLSTLVEVIHGHTHHEVPVMVYYGYRWLAHACTCQCGHEFYVVYQPAHPALRLPAVSGYFNQCGHDPTDRYALYCPLCGLTHFEVGAAIIPTEYQPEDLT